MKTLDDKKRAAIEAIAPGKRTYTTYRWDADMETLQRLIALKPWEREGADFVQIEWTEPDTKMPITVTLDGVEFTGDSIKQGKAFSFSFATYLHPTENGTWFSIEDMAFRFPLAYNEELAKDNEARGLKPSPEILEAIKREKARERKEKKSLAPRNFNVGAIAFASNFAGDRDLHRGLALRDREDAWRRNENEGHKHYRGKECDVLYKPAELFPEDWWSEHKEAALAALDRRFRTIRNDLTADIIDVMFHHWRTTKKRNDSPTAVEKTGITLRKICQYRGIEPKGENIRIAYLAMRDVRAFRLKGGGIDAALFDIDTVKLQPTLPELWQNDEPPQADTGFIYSPGFFLSKAVDDEPVYFAPYVQKLWELDPKYHAKAKRFARYLRGEWRLNTQKYLRPDGQNPTRWRTWRDVLTDAGIDFEGYEATKDPRRFIKSIHEAIETLYDIEAIRECGAAIYHPDDRAIYESLPRKGVLNFWLNLRVCIEPPAEIRDALLNTNKKRIARTIRAQEAKALPTAKRKGRPKKQKDG
jgi:hypothetical protein